MNARLSKASRGFVLALTTGFIIVGSALRLYEWGRIPNWLNFDEAQVGVEAFSLLRTGQDHLGNRYPIYFPGWGSGLNALYVYLSIPFVAANGLNVLSVRAVQLIAGIAALPLMYLTGARLFDRATGCMATALLALLPWHIMSSRWGLESNIEPTVILLGLLALASALDNERSWLFKPATALAWSASIYTYSATLAVIPAFALIVLLVYASCIRRAWRAWLTALVVAALACLPMAIWTFKNFLLRSDLAWEHALPFSVPLFPATRLASAAASGIVRTLADNVNFLVFGFDDGWIWNRLRPFLPLSALIPFVAIFGTINIILNWRRRAGLLPALLSCAYLAPALSFQLNVNRANGLLTAFVLLAAHGFVLIRRSITQPNVLSAAFVASFAYLGFFCTTFYWNYFKNYNGIDAVASSFNAGLPDAYAAAVAASGASGLIWIKEPEDFVAPLLLVAADPDLLHEFRMDARYGVDNGIYRYSSFGRFRFGLNRPASTPFTYLARPNTPICEGFRQIYRSPYWMVGECGGPRNSIIPEPGLTPPAPPPTVRNNE